MITSAISQEKWRNAMKYRHFSAFLFWVFLLHYYPLKIKQIISLRREISIIGFRRQI